MTPIGVFGHKRPEHVRACLEAIERSFGMLGRELPVVIFCDAARHEGEEEQVAGVVRVAREWGKGEVVVREKNFGFRNITEGISQLCERYGRVIVIEDDVLVAPDFLPFVCRALDMYEGDPRVFMVSGFGYVGAEPEGAEAYFLSAPFIWGWATWKRAWDHFEWECSGWEGVVRDKRVAYRYDCLGSMPFSKGLRKTVTGQWQAWGPRWMYAMHKGRGLCLYPHRSLVWNCGCGGGTHGDGALDFNPADGEREVYIHGDLEMDDFKRPRLEEGMTFPKAVAEHKGVMRSLAVTFLEERLRKGEKKRIRLRGKLLYHRVMRLISRTKTWVSAPQSLWRGSRAKES